MALKLKTEVDPSEYDCGVIVARFQIDRLHTGHKALIDSVYEHHKKVIIFLGLPAKDKGGSRKNPLPYAAREKMVKTAYPSAIVIPIQNKRSDEVWSNELDRLIKMPFGNAKFLLYGARDSFLEHYCGKYDYTELTSDIYYSSTAVREALSGNIPDSEEWRAGVIYAMYDRYPITYPTVDIIPYKDGGKMLLAQRANSDQWRMVGGFVDRNDESYEAAAARELREEAGSWEHDKMEYVTSGQVDDWRYRGEEDGIMTTVFKCKHLFGRPEGGDDISVVKWWDIDEVRENLEDGIEKLIVPEHIKFVQKFLDTHKVEEFDPTGKGV